MYSLNKNLNIILFSKNFFFVIFLLTPISIYFNLFSWFFIIILLSIFLFLSSSNIYFENRNIFYLIIMSFFFKFFINEFLYIYYETKGYSYGTLGGSDDISYFLRGKIIAEFFRNNLSHELNHRIFSTNLNDNEFFNHINALINYVDTNISLKEVTKIGIFLNTFSAIIFYNICTNHELKKKSIFLIILLFIIDFKINFYSNFNLKEIYVLFSSISLIYLCSTIITNKFENKIILFLSIFGILLSIFLRFKFFLLFIFIIISTIFIKFFLINTNFFKSYLKLKIILFLIFFILIIYYINPLNLFIDYNNVFSPIFYDPNNSDDSISNKFYNLKYSDNIFYFFVHFFSGMIAIFPIYKEVNMYLTFQLYAQIWSHLLIISSCFFCLSFIKNLKKIDFNLKFLILIIFFKSLLILIISTLISMGSLSFFRYSLFFNIFLIFIIGSSLEFNFTKKLVIKTVLIYFCGNLILLLPYYLLKSSLI